jgi:hypothetical protein
VSTLAVVRGRGGEAPEPLARSREEVERTEQFLTSEEARQLKHSDMEREIEERGRAVMREWMQAWLELQEPGETEEPVVDAEGSERTRKRAQSRELETIFGTLTLERTGYGTPGKESLHPLDGKLNLSVERYSLEVRRRAAEEAAKHSFAEAAKTLARYTGAHVPQRQLEELVQRAAVDFDDFYETRRQEGTGPPPGKPGSLMVITTDAKGVVMRKEDLRRATRKAAAKKEPKLRTRLTRGEKTGRKRMATVASVYTVRRHERTPEQVLEALARTAPKDGERPKRPRPEHKRVWASLEKEPHEVLEEAFHEALDRDFDRQLTWVSVVDGNEHQLKLLEALAKHYGVQLTIALDIIHVSEYLWKAGHAFAAEGSPELEAWVFERLGRILRGGASQVAAGMRRSATKRGLARDKRRPVDTCADYLLKYRAYLAYDRYLTAGMPIASGVIEGACRHLVKDRLAVTGARWRLRGAEAVLRLRALRSSGDFDAYWRFHEAREHERNHQARYADARLPAVTDPRKSRPKLVE